MTALSVSGLEKSFGPARALGGVSFDVEAGEFFTILGPTNAGKSTLLKTIAGLHRPDAGSIAIGGRPANDLAPRDRQVSLLFQNIALFPALTGFENIAFPLRTAGAPDERVRERVLEVARMLRIEHVLDRLPRTFSGGEQQRTAIGRAIAQRSLLLLLDEPLTNLDARIRIALRLELRKLHRDTGQTMIYVTHDQTEAMSLSDRIAVLHEGRLEQIGTPDEIYHRPRTAFVARFVGTPPMNLLPVEPDGGTELRGAGFAVPIPLGIPVGRIPGRLAVGVRPEEIRVQPVAGDDTPFSAEVLWVEHLGSKSILDLRLGGEPVKAVVPPSHPALRESTVWLGFGPRADRLLNVETSEFLR